ncbi:HEPN domain-containing protein [Thermus igniterrae]|jgi:HEPN domain-containing protein|uniref:HEPN domain-containing protein n=1 Tax=Thermus igniterrae TaxID=88189 RepID=UPI00037E3007|nr:HEPN domain-containing protein [Thermus igniterrae]
MSEEKRRLEGKRWLLQGEGVLLEAGKYAQAAFLAQQAGEKALKGLWVTLGLDPWGHSLARFIRKLPGEVGARLFPLLPVALALDKLYIPTRYPDALPGLTPKEAYTREEAAEARTLLEAIQEVLREG